MGWEGRGWDGRGGEVQVIELSGGRYYVPCTRGMGLHTISCKLSYQLTNRRVQLRARNTEMAGDISVACLHDPWSGQTWHADTDRVTERGSVGASKGAIRSKGGQLRWSCGKMISYRLHPPADDLSQQYNLSVVLGRWL